MKREIDEATGAIKRGKITGPCVATVVEQKRKWFHVSGLVLGSQLFCDNKIVPYSDGKMTYRWRGVEFFANLHSKAVAMITGKSLYKKCPRCGKNEIVGWSYNNQNMPYFSLNGRTGHKLITRRT